MKPTSHLCFHKTYFLFHADAEALDSHSPLLALLMYPKFVIFPKKEYAPRVSSMEEFLSLKTKPIRTYKVRIHSQEGIVKDFALARLEGAPSFIWHTLSSCQTFLLDMIFIFQDCLCALDHWIDRKFMLSPSSHRHASNTTSFAASPKEATCEIFTATVAVVLPSSETGTLMPWSLVSCASPCCLCSINAAYNFDMVC